MSLAIRARRLVRRARARLVALQSTGTCKYDSYRDRPEAFARDVLKVDLVPLQVEVARALLVPPYRVLVPSGNNLGKTLLAAAIVLWWFCTRSPAMILTTAPTYDQVRDLLWKEIRRLAREAGLTLPFLPKACRIERSPDDFAVGTTARGEGGLKGKHGPNQMFVFDEATDVAAEFWTAVDTMFQPPGHAWLSIFNPTDPSSRAYQEHSAGGRNELGRPWHIVRMSALDHPNVIAGLKGQAPPVQHAIQLATLERRIPALCQLVTGEPTATDIEWPPAWAKEYTARTGIQPRWWRPGPDAEATLLGRFPSQGAYSVWGEGDWQAACREGLEPLEIPLTNLPVIGCDTAHGGMDNTEFHVRCGPCSLAHDRINGHSTPQIVGRLIELARQWARWHNQRIANLPASQAIKNVTEFQIPINIDDAPVGFGVLDDLKAAGYAVTGVTAASNPIETDRYPNKRSELWFVTAEMARVGEIDVSRLSADWQDELGRQAKSAGYSLDGRGRRVVDPKDKLKEKLGRSPDSCDAFNLAYYAGGSHGVGPTVVSQRGSPFGGYAGGFRR